MVWSGRDADGDPGSDLRIVLDAVARGRKRGNGPEHDRALTALYAIDEDDADLAPALLDELARRPRGEARVMIVRALGQIGAGLGGDFAAGDVTPTATTAVRTMRIAASAALAGCLDDGDVWVRVHALISLAAVGWSHEDVATAARIAALARDEHVMTRVGALGALAGQRGERAAVAELAVLARTAAVGEASWALQMLCEASAHHVWVIDELVALLDHWSDEFRETIARTFTERAPADVVPMLVATGPSEGGFLALRTLGERARPWSAAITELACGAIADGPARGSALRALAGLAVDRDRVAATLDAVVARLARPGDVELGEALARDVCEHPEERDARARYARFLDLEGDPRGEVIRRALANPDDPRIAILLETRGDAWTPNVAGKYQFKLGLPWHVDVSALADFAVASRYQFDRHPIASLHLHVRGTEQHLAALAKILQHWLPRLLDLAITAVEGGPPLDAATAAMDAIARAPRLRSLALHGLDGEAAVRTLVDLQAPITELALDPAPEAAFVEALAVGALPRLRVLVLPGPLAPAIVDLTDDPETIIEICALPPR